MKHNILIQWADNGGVILTVGCKTLVFELLGQALVEVEKYANDPQGTYDHYSAQFGWAPGALGHDPGAMETIGADPSRLRHIGPPMGGVR